MLNTAETLDEIDLRSNLTFHLIIYDRMHLCNKCLLSIFSVPGSMLGTSETTKL